MLVNCFETGNVHTNLFVLYLLAGSFCKLWALSFGTKILLVPASFSSSPSIAFCVRLKCCPYKCVTFCPTPPNTKWLWLSRLPKHPLATLKFLRSLIITFGPSQRPSNAIPNPPPSSGLGHPTNFVVCGAGYSQFYTLRPTTTLLTVFGVEVPPGTSYIPLH